MVFEHKNASKHSHGQRDTRPTNPPRSRSNNNLTNPNYLRFNTEDTITSSSVGEANSMGNFTLGTGGADSDYVYAAGRDDYRPFSNSSHMPNYNQQALGDNLQPGSSSSTRMQPSSLYYRESPRDVQPVQSDFRESASSSKVPSGSSNKAHKEHKEESVPVPPVIPTTLVEGFLLKRHPRHDIWQNRWVKLCGCTLRYYGNPAESHPRGTLDFKHSLWKFQVDLTGRKIILSLAPKNKGRTYYFKVPQNSSPRKSREWIDELTLNVTVGEKIYMMKGDS